MVNLKAFVDNSVDCVNKVWIEKMIHYMLC